MLVFDLQVDDSLHCGTLTVHNGGIVSFSTAAGMRLGGGMPGGAGGVILEDGGRLSLFAGNILEIAADPSDSHLDGIWVRSGGRLEVIGDFVSAGRLTEDVMLMSTTIADGDFVISDTNALWGDLVESTVRFDTGANYRAPGLQQLRQCGRH
jgi:hypothetical protein